jgi:hypothetical protein
LILSYRTICKCNKNGISLQRDRPFQAGFAGSRGVVAAGQKTSKRQHGTESDTTTSSSKAIRSKRHKNSSDHQEMGARYDEDGAMQIFNKAPSSTSSGGSTIKLPGLNMKASTASSSSRLDGVKQTIGKNMSGNFVTSPSISSPSKAQANTIASPSSATTLFMSSSSSLPSGAKVPYKEYARLSVAYTQSLKEQLHEKDTENRTLKAKIADLQEQRDALQEALDAKPTSPIIIELQTQVSSLEQS